MPCPTRCRCSATTCDRCRRGSERRHSAAGHRRRTARARRSCSATSSSTCTRCARIAGVCGGRTTWGLGIAALAAFLITLVTGVLLMFYYKPYPDAAYDSIKDIHFVVPTGRFIRNIHRWAANLMVVTVLLHMARAFYTAAYRAPREFNWLVGMALLVVTLGLSFTGYLLPWDQLAYWAITIGANIAQSPREVTDALGITQILRPRRTSEAAAARLGYGRRGSAHPLLSAARDDPAAGAGDADGGALLAHPQGRRAGAAGRRRPTPRRRRPGHLPGVHRSAGKTYHLAAIVRGRTPTVGHGPENTVPSMPHLFYAELAVLMLTVCICARARAPVGRAAQGSGQPAGAREPGQGAVVLPRPAGTGVLLGVHGRHRHPVDRARRPRPDSVSRPRAGRHGRVVRRAGRVAAGPATRWRSALQPRSPSRRSRSASAGCASGSRRPAAGDHAVNPGTVLTAIYAVYSLGWCGATTRRAPARLALFTCFLCGFVVLTVIGTYFRGPNWDFYWSPADWPAH